MEPQKKIIKKAVPIAEPRKQIRYKLANLLSAKGGNPEAVMEAKKQTTSKLRRMLAKKPTQVRELSRQLRWKLRRKAAGLCVGCADGKQSPRSRTLCESCLDKALVRVKRNQAKQKTESAAEREARLARIRPRQSAGAPIVYAADVAQKPRPNHRIRIHVEGQTALATVEEIAAQTREKSPDGSAA